MSDGKTSLNLELLIKLLKLTTSSNDGEALLASRKANEVLGKFGGDWEALLHGKVTVIADPFAASVAAPQQFQQHRPPPPAPHPKPAQTQTPFHGYRQSQPRGGQGVHFSPQQAARPQPQPQPRPQAATPAQASPTRNTLRKQRVTLDDLA